MAETICSVFAGKQEALGGRFGLAGSGQLAAGRRSSPKPGRYTSFLPAVIFLQIGTKSPDVDEFSMVSVQTPPQFPAVFIIISH